MVIDFLNTLVKYGAACIVDMGGRQSNMNGMYDIYFIYANGKDV